MDLILSRMQAVFRKVLDQDELVLKPELTALDVEGWDSLAHVQIVVSLEKEFEIRFRTADIIGLKNVGDLLEAVSSRLTLLK